MIEPCNHLVIGIGNEYRRDDAVGLIVARRLKARGGDGVSIVEHSGEGAALMALWREATISAQTQQKPLGVIVIDAIRSGGEAGTVFRFEAHTAIIPTQFFHYSSHAFGLAEAIELARALQQLPPRLIVYGIEGKDFAAGAGLSPRVEKSVPAVVDRVWQDVVKFPGFAS